MANPTTGTGFALTVERTIAAPPERVFEAFTQAQQLARWFRPGEDFKVTVHALDARVGGRYRFEMRKPDGSTSIVAGTYDEVARPRRLVFSWAWEDKPQDGMSRVTVTIEPKGDGARLVLVHEQLPTVESREAHTHGWNGCLDTLLKQF